MILFLKKISRNKKKLHEITKKVSSSIVGLKAEIAMQQKWISYLHNSYMQLKSSHDSHKQLSDADLRNIKRWISGIEASVKRQDSWMLKTEKAISKAFESYNSHLIKMFKQQAEAEKRLLENKNRLKALEEKQKDEQEIIKAELKIMKEHIKLEIAKEIEEKLGNVGKNIAVLKEQLKAAIKSREKKDNARAIERSVIGIEKSREIKELKRELSSVKQLIASEKKEKNFSKPIREKVLLSKPEQKLANILMAEGDSLSYGAISKKTGHSINTIRVVMNSLKKKGIIEETVLPSGVKLFSVKHDEKIKKIYNLEHI